VVQHETKRSSEHDPELRLISQVEHRINKPLTTGSLQSESS